MSKAAAWRAKPVKAWASVYDENPPRIVELQFYREHLQSNLRAVRVLVTPIPPKKRQRMGVRQAPP